MKIIETLIIKSEEKTLSFTEELVMKATTLSAIKIISVGNKPLTYTIITKF